MQPLITSLRMFASTCSLSVIIAEYELLGRDSDLIEKYHYYYSKFIFEIQLLTDQEKESFGSLVHFLSIRFDSRVSAAGENSFSIPWIIRRNTIDKLFSTSVLVRAPSIPNCIERVLSRHDDLRKLLFQSDREAFTFILSLSMNILIHWYSTDEDVIRGSMKYLNSISSNPSLDID